MSRTRKDRSGGFSPENQAKLQEQFAADRLREIREHMSGHLSGMSIQELCRLADEALLIAQCRKEAGPGFKGLRVELQNFVEGDYGPIEWVCRET